MPLSKQCENQNRPKKLIISPFCTNPSQLQEITLDPDATNNFSYMGMRSPGAVTGGRSVKEIDEQLTTLKKENFDLKLRIYFLEERIGANFDTDKEDAIKKNIELRVELENTRKDVEEKQELLCQAAKAMEIEEEEKKKEIELRDEQIAKLNEELLDVRNRLQVEIKLREETKQVAFFAQTLDLNVAGDSVNKLHTKIKELEDEVQKEREHSDELEQLLNNTEYHQHRYKSLEVEVESKNLQLNTISNQLKEANNKLSKCSSEISNLQEEIISKNSQIQSFQQRLTHKNCQLEEYEAETRKLTKMCSNYQARLNDDPMTRVRISRTPEAESSTQQVAIPSSMGQEIAPFPLSKINTSHSTTSVSPVSPRMLQHKKLTPNEAGELVLYSNSPETNSVTEICSEAYLSHEKHLELQRDHFKACKMIKSLIQKKKECDQNIHELNLLVTDKDKTIEYLQARISDLALSAAVQRQKPIQEMVTQLKLTGCFDPATTRENSMDVEELNLTETYKVLVDELEIKIEVLTVTLNEKDLQLEQLKIDVQEKANRIIDLEFDLLAVSEGVSYSIDLSNEKGDTETEKSHKDFDKDQQIKKLEYELRRRTSDLQGIVNKELWEKNRAIEKMQNILKHRDVEMNSLEQNIRAKDLQLKILKDKINELGVHVNLPPSLFTVQPIIQLDTPDTVYLEERKHFIKEIEELQRKINNIPEHDENHQLKQLKTEYDDLREELEKTEKLRQESHEICLVLTARLEELCCFLNSLLKQKCVLGFLGTEQVCKLQEAVNRSLDLSQILSSSLLHNPDQSLLQLNNITNLLNSTCNDSAIFGKLSVIPDDDNNAVLSIVPSDVKLTYRSHLNISVGTTNEHEQVIKILRQQISNLKHEVELRDVELGKKLNPDEKSHSPKINTSQSLINRQKDSDSESWSEPDRSVSLARIGLLDESLKVLSNSSINKHRFAAATAMSTESTEDEPILHGVSGRTPSKRTTLAESRQTVISLHEQVCELEEKLKEKENELLAAQVAMYETENLLKKEQLKLAEMKKEVSDNIAEINKQFKDSESKRKHAEQKAKETNDELTSLQEQINKKNKTLQEAEKIQKLHETKILELQNLVSTLESFKSNATGLHTKNKELQNTINELEIEKEKAIESAKTTKSKLEKANVDVEAVKVELSNMQKREQQIGDELEKHFQLNLKNAEEQYINSVRSIERNYEVQISKSQDTVIKMKEEYEKNYIRRSEVDQRMIELDGITKEVESLKYFVKDCDNKMHIMEERETELKTKIQEMQREHHDKIYELHSELDNATLQYSEALLEKTRLQNETTCMEQRIQNFHVKENQLLHEVGEMHKDFKEIQNNLQMQIAQLEQQKSLLEMKVRNLELVNAELQSVDAELRNDLVKMQINRNIGERMLSTSLPTCTGAILDLYPNKTLPVNIAFNSNHALSDNSGYTSEDIIIVDEVQKPSVSIGVDRDRINANSSPDLGIESDHGRFSSMECNANISRPLLPTLELTQSMNSLLDPIQDITCSNDQCCMKTKRIADENVELRKRLLRTRRALEDTLHRLTLANKHKKEVEKSICKQIHQTSQVLRKAKANLDSGSEGDVQKN